MNRENPIHLGREVKERHRLAVGDHVTVRDGDHEGIITTVHPDSTVEVELLNADDGQKRRRHYSLEAIQSYD